jgi:type IV pilus assembly protein PilV
LADELELTGTALLIRALDAMKKIPKRQSGSSLIEVLVAVLILSFGLLALGGMLTFSVQLPKLSAYRATATNLASSYVERIRANPDGFSSGNYTTSLNDSGGWSFTTIAVSGSNCKFSGGTQCTSATLANADINEFRNSVRRELLAGDSILKCSSSPCAKTSYGELWVIWQEPSTFAVFDPSSSDNCPSEATTALTTPKPRCLYVRFQIE